MFWKCGAGGFGSGAEFVFGGGSGGKQCYTKPAVDTEDERLVSLAAQMNQYVGAVVTHTFGSSQEVLDGDTIHQWIVTDGTTASIDESQAAAYVKALAKTYDTAYQTKTLKTSYGKTVKITKGNYGWRINQAAETAAILEIIRNGEQQTREPDILRRRPAMMEMITAIPMWRLI